jgi:CBS domain-containing protein
MFTMKVREMMTTAVVTATPETPLKEVARRMVERAVSGIPIVEADGRVVGVVSEADFLVKERGAEGIRHRPLAWLFGESRATRHAIEKVQAVVARDAMTSPAVTIAAERSVRDAADLMIERRVNRLPVVDEAGTLVGIVTRADIVRAFVRPDLELAGVIRKDILERSLWIEPHEIELSVSRGIVSVKGAVDRRSTAEVLEELVGRVDGVVAVDADLTWRLDDSKVEADKPEMVFPLTQR